MKGKIWTPQTEDQKAAVWAYFESLPGSREDRFDRVARELGTTVRIVQLCRPKALGDTHIHDIGRAMDEKGVHAQHQEFEMPSDERVEEVLRSAIGQEVLRAFFLKLLPSRFRLKWERKEKRIRIPDDAEVKRYGWRSTVTLPDGTREYAPRGAVIVTAPPDEPRIYLNARLRRDFYWQGKRRRTRVLKLALWIPGKVDWEPCLRRLMSYAALFCPDAVGNPTGEAIAALFDVTRQEVSRVNGEIVRDYQQATGGTKSGLGVVRATEDPRRGVKRKLEE